MVVAIIIATKQFDSNSGPKMEPLEGSRGTSQAIGHLPKMKQSFTSHPECRNIPTCLINGDLMVCQPQVCLRQDFGQSKLI